MTSVALSSGGWINVAMSPEEVVALLTDLSQGMFVALVDESGQQVFVNRRQVTSVVER